MNALDTVSAEKTLRLVFKFLYSLEVMMKNRLMALIGNGKWK